jgi:DNA-binding response OmpR family regulator
VSHAGSLLLIDDEPQVVDLLRDFFEGQGYSVMSALTGRDALVLASLTRPDAVLLDVRMSEMQGPDVLRGLLALDPSIRVVMLSAADDEALARDLLRAGALDYVRKPFMFDHLDTVVRTAVLLGRRPQLRELQPPCGPQPWALAENDLDGPDLSCTLCEGPVQADDTSALRQGGAMYHAACWLGRFVETATADRPLAARA